jgi:hypothetical protein
VEDVVPPVDPASMFIHPAILSDVRCRAKVFVGHGTSQMDDRMHIRDCLSQVGGHVTAHVGRPNRDPGGTEVRVAAGPSPLLVMGRR